MAKILIVDDDPDVVETLTLYLGKEGHEVASAYNRSDGAVQVEQFKPDLIVLDVMMEQPDDGLTMAQELRRRGFRKPILMLTSVGKASGMKFDKDPEMVPVEDFQEKPIEPSVLVEKVAALLKRTEG